MRLRRQLFLVSLLILCLPWAGLQTIRELEHSLRDGQASALLASALAVSARLESEAVDIRSTTDVALAEQQLYLHPIRQQIILDGYDNEWQSLPFTAREFALSDDASTAVSLRAASSKNDIHLLFNISDSSPLYHDPQRSGIANGDHLLLRAQNSKGETVDYFIRGSAPGNFTARYYASGYIRRENRIRGMWLETAGGYRLELILPKELAAGGLGFSYNNFNRAIPEQSPLVGTLTLSEQPLPWVTINSRLENILEPYTRRENRLSVVDKHAWLLARSGELASPASDQEASNERWQRLLFRWILGAEQFQALPNPRLTGRMEGLEVEAALLGYESAQWYQRGQQRVGRAAVPIRVDGDIVGAVTVEQSTDSLLALTNSAFGNLVYYTLLATLIAGFGLLAYASLLSFRIRRLSRAADSAVADDGSINTQFVQSRSKDEIGDLSRSYGQLLQRLGAYTEYLRTLASKLSHELRTPLAVVRSSLENLEHYKIEAGAEQYTQRAKDGIERLSAILNAMSSASRVEESIQQASTEHFLLDQLLRELIVAYKGAYPGTHLKLNITESANDCQFVGAPELIVQLLDKLVDNASDFCDPEGEVVIALERDRQHIRLSVTNDGPQLPEHMQGQLFDSLVSVREGGDAGAHLGLGLYIVRLIADFHHGQVQADNVANGVRFTVVLPVA